MKYYFITNLTTMNYEYLGMYLIVIKMKAYHHKIFIFIKLNNHNIHY